MELWQALGRFSGLAALVFLAAGMISGMGSRSFSLFGEFRRVDFSGLHRNLSILTIVFSLAHVVFLAGGLSEIPAWLSPFAPLGRAGGFSWFSGAVGLYLLLWVLLQAFLQRKRSHPAWLWLHRFSLPAFLLILLHAWFLGTDPEIVRWVAGICFIALAWSYFERMGAGTVGKQDR